MTLVEMCQAIEVETRTRTWAEATLALRVLVIQSFVESFLEQSEPGAVKKVIKRRPRKTKDAPLTQHAEDGA